MSTFGSHLNFVIGANIKPEVSGFSRLQIKSFEQNQYKRVVLALRDHSKSWLAYINFGEIVDLGNELRVDLTGVFIRFKRWK